jgi:tetratricopeptide (TPR) repeat protein
VRRVLYIAASILASCPVDAGAEWLALRSAHHEVAGNVSARELKSIALRLEQFRDVLAALNQATIRAVGDTAVVVLVFPDERSFRPFTPLANGRRVPSDGLFVNGLSGAYITLKLNAAEESYRAICHEYSHFVLRSTFGAAPLWFSEGFAEYYSTLEVARDGHRALIGRPIAQHVELLRERQLPLAKLLSITGASPIYTTDTPDRHVLYAESWALVHHALHSEPRRRDALVNLAFKLAAGASPEQAVRETYGMALTDLERELQAYIRREFYQATSVEFKTPVVTSVSADAVPADQADVEAWLGGVQASIGRPDEAAVRLEKALKARPDLGRAHAAMAAVRLLQGRRGEANLHLQAAAKANALARPDAQVRVQITGREARQAAARAFLKSGNYAGVRDALRPIVTTSPADHDDALILAEALLHLDDPDGARVLLGPVLAAATTEARTTQARALLAQAAELRARLGDPPIVPTASSPASERARTISNPTPSPSNRRLLLRKTRDGEERTFGTLQAIECRRDGVVIVVHTTDGITRASAPSLSAIDFVTFRSQTAGSVTCGAQDVVPALVTSRRNGTGVTAVALELLPDGYVP